MPQSEPAVGQRVAVQKIEPRAEQGRTEPSDCAVGREGMIAVDNSGPMAKSDSQWVSII